MERCCRTCGDVISGRPGQARYCNDHTQFARWVRKFNGEPEPARPAAPPNREDQAAAQLARMPALDAREVSISELVDLAGITGRESRAACPPTAIDWAISSRSKWEPPPKAPGEPRQIDEYVDTLHGVKVLVRVFSTRRARGHEPTDREAAAEGARTRSSRRLGVHEVDSYMTVIDGQAVEIKQFSPPRRSEPPSAKPAGRRIGQPLHGFDGLWDLPSGNYRR